MSIKKIAVIGSGPAGLGVLTGLIRSKSELEITLFDIAKEEKEHPSISGKDTASVEEFYKDLYAVLKNKFKFKFPPPKTHFGEKLEKFCIDDKEKVFKSEHIGGLSNFWGAGSLPFSDIEFNSWPVKRSEMDPYYRKMAELIGISGRKDKLNEYYQDDFSNRPAIQLPSICQKLDTTINSKVSREKDKYNIISGVSRCMVETRDNSENSCVYCGECLQGCFNNSIYSTKTHVNQMLQNEDISLIKGKVYKVDGANGKVIVKTIDGLNEFSGFDKIYLAAGCPNSSEIVMRSLGLSECEMMSDNSVYILPLFYWGSGASSDIQDRHMSLANLIWGIVPRKSTEKFAQASVYVNFDYLWRYNMNNKTWKTFKSIIRHSRYRLFWVRIYLHGNSSHGFRLNIKNDQLSINYAKHADTSVIKDIMKSLRHSVNANGFYIPPFISGLNPLLQKANSHYSSTFPYNGKLLKLNKYGEFMPHTYLCDSSVFPDLPANSLTFTIMANACRVSSETVNN